MTQQASEPDQDLPIMHGPSGTLAVAALILGLVGMAMALLDLGFSHVGVRTIGVEHPPSLLAVNLSFCSLLMGVAAIYRVRRMPHQTATRLAAIAAVILGLVGPMVFSFQAAHWRKVRAEAEISNVQTIIQACRTWAHHHDGHFPASLGLLAAKGNIDFHILGSPYNPRLEESSCIPFGPSDHLEGAELESLTTAYNNQSDYLYVGSDLTETQAASPDARPS